LRRLLPPRMKKSLSRTSRGVAFVLAAIWLAAGVLALAAAFAHRRVLPGAIAIAAIVYGLIWRRAAARAQLLTWRELVAPWRSGRRAGPDRE
jgi:hypothetical protein